ncbi:cell wall hydrolase [Pseudorhodoplanes sp.]|uniref:cell wall hydrolase n=1 Tax=Pseudorhodoplanes sp. TaxID=1934341 RepID=UPI003D12D957
MRGSFASLYLACATIAAIAIGTPANAYRAPVEETRVALGDPINRSRDIAYETDLYCLTLAVYFEGGSTGETEEGQRHIANVVAARARANRQIWGGDKICDVVFYKRSKVCQFSFACLPVKRRTAIKGNAWRYSKQIARDELEGRSGLEDRLLRYYMNASLTPPKNACRFRKEFVPVVQAGRHEFFREASRAERRALEKAEHEECKKYEASLKKKKHAKSRKGAKDVKTAKGPKNNVAGAAAKKQPPKKVNVAKR